MVNYSAIALLGAVKSVIGPEKANGQSWPKFATVVTASGATEILDNDIILAGYSQQSGTLTGTVGTTRGFRNAYFTAPTQTISAATANVSTVSGGVEGALVTQGTTARTWYPTSPS